MIEFALTANIAVFVITVVILARRGYLNLYSGLAVYLAFHFMAFVQRPLVVYAFDFRSEYIFMEYMPTDDVFLETIFISNVGLLSFVFGYLAVMRFTPTFPSFQTPTVGPIERKSFKIAFWLLSPLMAYSMFLLLTVQEGWSQALDPIGQLNMKVDPATGLNLFTDTSAYIVFARNMILPFTTYLILIYRGRWWSFLPLAIYAFFALQTGGRWPFVVSALVAVTSMMYLGRISVPRLRDVGIGLTVLTIFVVMSEHRDIIVKFLTTGDLDFEINFADSSFGAHPDFANFEFLSYVVGKVPEVSRTWSYFTQYLGLFTQPIPRMFWPDKPVVSPILLVNLQAYGRFATRTPSLVGDGWMSLGYPGVIITLGLVGAFYGWLYKRFCRTPVSVYYYCVYFWMQALLIQWARDGGYKITDFFFFCITPIVLAYYVRKLLSPVPRLGSARLSHRAQLGPAP